VQKVADPLADNGRGLVEKADELFKKLGRSADRMEELVENLLLFSQALNRSDGTLGKLINDPRLYNNLTDATDQVNRLAIELRPVLYNARLFTDQLARNPEKLGVRGALERGSSGDKPVRGVCP
jgi:phospholipid/cholesterol/gamma-HCH transport system substrate-binding protein